MFWNAPNHQIIIKSRCGFFVAVALEWRGSGMKRCMGEATHSCQSHRKIRSCSQCCDKVSKLCSVKKRGQFQNGTQIYSLWTMSHYMRIWYNMILYIQIGQLVDDQPSSGSIRDGNLVWFRCLKVAQEPEVLVMRKWWYISVTCIYLEPVWPLFWGLNPPKEGPFQSQEGSFGFQVDMHRCSSEFTLANGVLDVSWRRFFSRIGRNGLHRSLGWRGFRWIKHICHLQTPDIIHINSHLISLISQNCVYAYMCVVLGIMYNR